MGGGPGVGDDNVPKAETIGLDSGLIRETKRRKHMRDTIPACAGYARLRTDTEDTPAGMAVKGNVGAFEAFALERRSSLLCNI